MNVFVISHTSGVYMYPATHRVYKTEGGVMKEYKKLVEQGTREGLKVLKAQWVEADFEEYEEFKEELK